MKGNKGDKGDTGDVSLEQLENATKTTKTTEVLEEITVNDSCQANIDLKISGNSVQEEREGYNLLNYDTLTSRTISGITYTINDDKSITANGTATANSTLNLVGGGNNYPLNLESGDYTLSGCKDGSKDTYMLEIYNGTAYKGNVDGNTSINFSEDTAIRAYITVKNGVTLSNVTFYPMLYKGTQEKEYEQFGAMPSTQYSSEIRNCGDNINLLKAVNKSGSINGIDYTIENETITTSGTSTSARSISLSDLLEFPIVLEKGKQYTQSIEIIDGSLDGFAVVVAVEDKNNNKKYNYLQDNMTKTVEEDYQISNYDIYIAKANTTVNCTFKIKLEQSSKATDWSKYGCGCVDIKVSNENNTEQQTIIFPLATGQVLHKRRLSRKRWNTS